MRISDWSSDVCSSDLLLLVAVMAVLVMSVLDDIRFGLRRASNAQSMAQAQWYARGAETLAMAQSDRLASRTPGRRSEERRVGKKGVSMGSSRWWPTHVK